jgi:hypothetical protein
MKWDVRTKILTMTQTDLEHTGFDWAEFEGTMFLNGMDEAEIKEALGAFTIVVAMHKGLYHNCKCGCNIIQKQIDEAHP